jgi:hypothetical protein
MKAVIATIRRQVPPQIIEHGLYAACLGWASTIVAVLGPHLAEALGSPLRHVAFALLAPGTCFNLFPTVIGLRPVVGNIHGIAGPQFTYVYMSLAFPVFFVACLTLPAAAFWWLLLREGATPRNPDPHAGGERTPPFPFLIVVWSIAAAFSAFSLAAVYGLIMARFFHRQGYFHEEAATEMLIYSALPCAFTPVILMIARRSALAAWRRCRA